ncbi:MAG: phosphotransferase [Candidatus Diapherotrites archaeon]|nr:phosphotransferase [Candidatus Diapherotrites archaeon]
MMHLKPQLEKYFAPKKVLSIEYLSKGFIGEVFLIQLQDQKGKKERVVIKSLLGDDYSYPLPHDQWHNFASSYYAAKNFEQHAKIKDIIGFDKNGFHSALPADQYFQVIEYKEGIPYAKDLERIRKEKTYNDGDEQKVKIIAQAIAALHKKPVKIPAEKRRAAYLRATRDLIGHSELAFALFDTYEKHDHWLKKEYETLFIHAFRLREKLKHHYERLRYVHGDYWYPNMIFHNNELILLDASRFPFGDPATDVWSGAWSTYFLSAILDNGMYNGPMNELGKLFMHEYLKKTGDEKISEFMPLYFSAILPIIIRPGVYNAPEETKRKVFKTCLDALKKGHLNWKNLNTHLE